MRVEDHEPARLSRLFASTAALSSRNARYWSLRVDRQREIAAVLRRADRLDVLDDSPRRSLMHAPAARLAAEPVLLRELDAFLADVVDRR